MKEKNDGKLKFQYYEQESINCCYNCEHAQDYYDMGMFCMWTKDGRRLNIEKVSFRRAVNPLGRCANVKVTGKFEG